MEEIKKLHDLNIEWGCITNLADHIMSIEDSIDGGWLELGEMVSEAMTEEGGNKKPEEVFFNLYGFLFHLLYRLKANPEKAPFNQYRKIKDQFWISNYDYNTFKWALSHGFGDQISNTEIKIDTDKLSEQQVKALEKRCK